MDITMEDNIFLDKFWTEDNVFFAGARFEDVFAWAVAVTLYLAALAYIGEWLREKTSSVFRVLRSAEVIH